jgi:hypothetical protein
MLIVRRCAAEARAAFSRAIEAACAVASAEGGEKGVAIVKHDDRSRRIFITELSSVVRPRTCERVRRRCFRIGRVRVDITVRKDLKFRAET